MMMSSLVSGARLTGSLDLQLEDMSHRVNYLVEVLEVGVLVQVHALGGTLLEECRGAGVCCVHGRLEV